MKKACAFLSDEADGGVRCSGVPDPPAPTPPVKGTGRRPVLANTWKSLQLIADHLQHCVHTHTRREKYTQRGRKTETEKERGREGGA